MASFKLEVSGLTEIREKYSKDKVEKSLIEAVGSVTLQMHNLLNSEVQRIYATNRSLNSVLSSPITKRSFYFVGKSLLEGNLEYKHEGINLGKFPFRGHFFGNLEEEKPRKGYVQLTKVLRKNNLKKVHGAKGFGGFRVKVSGATTFGRLMFERDTARTWESRGKRAKIHQLFGPSLAQMANTAFNKRSSKIKTFTNTFGDRVIKELKL